MGRAVTGRRHAITYVYERREGFTFVAARCVCDNLHTPHRFGKEKADADAEDHLWRNSK